MNRRKCLGLLASPVLQNVFAPAMFANTTPVDVFVSGSDGYHTFRIPAIVQSRKGTLLAFCEGRRASARDAGDIDLLLKRSTDGGHTWSKVISIVDFASDTAGNPAPVVDRKSGIVWLLLTRNPGELPENKTQAGISGPTRTVWVTHSKDDGLTWAAPVDITESVKKPDWTWYATGPGNGIQLRGGRFVIACDHNTTEGNKRYSHVIYSDDAGRTWKLGGSAGPNCNESTVAELHNGTLMLNMRSYQGKNRRAVSLSRDGGVSWSEPVLDDALVEPVCQASLLRLGKSGKKQLVFSNPASTKRMNMTLRLSRDDGRTWDVSKTVHAGPSAYSCLVELKGGVAGLLYERGERAPYERITFERILTKALSK